MLVRGAWNDGAEIGFTPPMLGNGRLKTWFGQLNQNVITLAPQMGKELPVNCLLRGAQGDSGGCWLHFFLWHLHMQPVSDHIHGGQQIARWEARSVSSYKPYTF